MKLLPAPSVMACPLREVAIPKGCPRDIQGTSRDIRGSDSIPEAAIRSRNLPLLAEYERITADVTIERFQAKWKPARVKQTRQNNNPEPRFDSIELKGVPAEVDPAQGRWSRCARSSSM